MSDFRVPMDAITSAFGVPVTVQWPAPDLTKAVVTGVWIPEFTVDVPGGGLANARREPRRVMAFRRDQVTTVPQKMLVVAPDIDGGPVRGWRVESVEYSDAEHFRVLLVRDDQALIVQ